MSPQAKRIDQIRKRIEDKYERNINNKKGNNQYTEKKDLVRKEEELSELRQFKKLSMLDQKDAISKIGNEIWVDGRELTRKKSISTKMKNEFFGWDFKED